jgi:hypothetical protein
MEHIVDIRMTFWRLLDERGSDGFAAADLRLYLGEDWKTASVQKARRMAEFIDDPLNPASALTVLAEQSGKIFVTSETHPLRAREAGPEEVALWIPDWRKISEQFSSALGFFPCYPRGEGTRQIGNFHSRKLASRPVFLHIPKGGNADCMSPLSEMATMSSIVLILLSKQRITPAINALAHDHRIILDSVIERLAAPDSVSIQIRTRLSVRPHKSTTARNLIDPILDVQTDWRWQKLKMTIDPTGSITAAYGKQRQSHTLTKANKTCTCRHLEILATMAVHGAWQPSRTNSEADKKAFKRLQAELQAILPLPGDPLRKEGAQFHPLFELTLPQEHWQDSNEENELRSEED